MQFSYHSFGIKSILTGSINISVSNGLNGCRETLQGILSLKRGINKGCDQLNSLCIGGIFCIYCYAINTKFLTTGLNRKIRNQQITVNLRGIQFRKISVNITSYGECIFCKIQFKQINIGN